MKNIISGHSVYWKTSTSMNRQKDEIRRIIWVMYPGMYAAGIRTIQSYGLNKGFSLKFKEIYQIWQVPEEGQRVNCLKRGQ